MDEEQHEPQSIAEREPAVEPDTEHRLGLEDDEEFDEAKYEKPAWTDWAGNVGDPSGE